MSKSVVAVVACTLLALVAASLVVPTRHEMRWKGVVVPDGSSNRVDWMRAWKRRDSHVVGIHMIIVVPEQRQVPYDWQGDAIHWPILFGQQALILLLGGSLLTVVVRRERRRKAAT